MTRLYFTFAALVFINSIQAYNDFCSLSTCHSTESSRQELKTFCSERNGKILKRCCIFNETGIGVDFSNCSIDSLSVFQKYIPVESQKSLEFILVDNNQIKSNDDYAFLNYLKLDYISVPWPLTCPGEIYSAWNKTERDEGNNATICKIQVTYCESHKDACIELEEYPDHAYCVPKGPSLFECPCSPGVYGYKCLRRGEFPTVIFAPIISVATVVLSVGLWYTQRRFVVSQPTQH